LEAERRKYFMIQAFVFVEAEPSRVQDLVRELAEIELDNSVVRQVHAITGRYDLLLLVESPDIQSLGD
jgi:DNA-binding Lrp family transcriptional regulator